MTVKKTALYAMSKIKKIQDILCLQHRRGENMKEELFELKLQGYCCSQMVMEMGLRALGKQNEDLIEAISALCGDVDCEKPCGVLTAAQCLLHLADPKTGPENAADLEDWFEDAFGDKICSNLMEGQPINKVEKCPVITEETIKYVFEILELEC